MNDLVSIIVPSYKREKWMVKRAIDSLLNQTYKNIEIIIIDDNARDDLQEYRRQIQELINDYSSPLIRYIKNDINLGGSGSRNVGIQNSKGTYITFLDDDDKYLPEKIEKQLKFMQENNLDMSFTDLALYNENEELIDYRDRSDIISFNKDILFKYHLKKHIAGTPTFMVKREILILINGFDIVEMGQEFYLMSKIINTNCKIGYLNRCDIIAYRTKAEAISTGKNKITGEKKLFDYKKQFFNILSFKEKQYIRCRHYAVMAMAYKRNRRYFLAIISLLKSVICSPSNAIKEAIVLYKNLKKHKGIRK